HGRRDRGGRALDDTRPATPWRGCGQENESRCDPRRGEQEQPAAATREQASDTLRKSSRLPKRVCPLENVVPFGGFVGGRDERVERVAKCQVVVHVRASSALSAARNVSRALCNVAPTVPELMPSTAAIDS